MKTPKYRGTLESMGSHRTGSILETRTEGTSSILETKGPVVT